MSNETSCTLSPGPRIKFVVGEWDDVFCDHFLRDKWRANIPVAAWWELGAYFSAAHPRNFEKLVTDYFKIRTTKAIWTNNPYLLDHVNADEVLVVHGANFKRLSEHQEYERWKNEMRPGEFWTTFGEAWVSDPPKEPEEGTVTNEQA